MQKTKLGISVGLLGAILCFSGLCMGYIVAILLAGYILLVEDNAWLRRTTVKVIICLVVFSILSIGIGLIPDFIGLINRVFTLFGGSFSLTFVSNLVYLLQAILDFIETVLYIALGLKALTQGTVVIPVIDNFISKNMD